MWALLRNEIPLKSFFCGLIIAIAFLTIPLSTLTAGITASSLNIFTSRILYRLPSHSDTIPKIKDSLDKAIENELDSIKHNLSDHQTPTANKTNYLKGGIDFVTNNVYLGRSDTGRTATLLPNLIYQTKWGVYASTTFYYIGSRRDHKLDGGSLDLGYNFDLTPRLSGSLAYSRMLYAQASTSIRSVISSTVTALLSYDAASVITPSVEISYNFNRKGISNDYMLNLGVAHDFIFTELFNAKDIGTLSPALNVNSGSQNFYEAYFQKIEAIKTKKGKSIKLTTGQLAYNKLINHTLEQGKKFQLLDYEVTLPFIYIIKRFTVNIVPTMALPRNLLPNRLLREISQQQTNFYLQAGIAYKL